LRFLVAAFLVCKLCFSLLVLGYGQTGTFLFNILSSCSYAVYRIVNFSSLRVPLCCNKLRLCTYKHTNIHTPSVWEHCGIATRYSNMIDILFTTNYIQQAAPIQWSPNHIILIHCCRLSPGHARVLNCKLLIVTKLICTLPPLVYFIKNIFVYGIYVFLCQICIIEHYATTYKLQHNRC
jgi:hypothetical protein